MGALTLEDLRRLREQKKSELSQRNSGSAAQVVIGMGTCGIAAGAKETFTAMIEEISAAGLDDVVVKQTGCMGLCSTEPTVEVIKAGMPAIIYGKVDAAAGRDIVRKHLAHGELVNDLIYDRPAADIVENN